MALMASDLKDWLFLKGLEFFETSLSPSSLKPSEESEEEESSPSEEDWEHEDSEEDWIL